MNEQLSSDEEPIRRPVRVILLLAGLIIPQAVLYGPSLIGQRILLPLDILRSGTFYLPPDSLSQVRDPDGQTRYINPFRPHNGSLSDQILSYEIERRFVAAEFRAGRIPLWSPYNYTGAPFVNWPKYSPFNLLYCLWPSAGALAWIQLLKSLIGGVGAYLFFRRTLSTGFIAAVAAAWCFPLTGPFIFWQGYPQTYVLVWLPWLLMIVDHLVRRPLGRAGPALTVMTAVVCVSGQLDTAGHVLIASGIFAAYGLKREYSRSSDWRSIRRTVAILVGGWATGFLLSAPELLPLAEYSMSGSRLGDIDEIAEDRPPSGIVAAPRIVLPRINGSAERGWHRFPGHSEFESASAAYAGLLVTLLAAPLAFYDRQRRGLCICLLFITLLGLSWELNIPGFLHLLKLPLLNLRPHNRFVCIASFALLALGAIGLDALCRQTVLRTRWLLVPAGLLLITGVYCGYRTLYPPEPLATELLTQIEAGITSRDIPDKAAIVERQQTWQNYLIFNLCVCVIGLVFVAGILIRPARLRFLAVLLLPFLCIELLGTGWNVNPQTDPSLDYPPLPELQKLATLPPGRVLGIGCLPPKLNEVHGLHELRGYDGIDPSRFVEVLRYCSDPRAGSPDYAKTLNFVPAMIVTEDGELRLPPVLSMLGVRYLIFPYRVPPGLTPISAIEDVSRDGGYAVVENHAALPRAFVPRTAKYFEKPKLILGRVTDPDFAPDALAYVEEPVAVPEICEGSATIRRETSVEIVVSASMKTKGLLVLADQWDAGWRAYSEGRELPVLRTNYIVRGVVLEPGDSTVVFRYEPASFTWGVRLMLAGLLILTVWSIRIRGSE